MPMTLSVRSSTSRGPHRGQDGRGSLAVAACQEEKTSQSYIARIEGGKGASIDGRAGALRSSDSHASADRLRTTRDPLIVDCAVAGSIPVCGRRSYRRQVIDALLAVDPDF